MSESPKPRSRQVTFDLDDLYRQRAEKTALAADLQRQLHEVILHGAGLDALIRLSEEKLGLVPSGLSTTGVVPMRTTVRRRTHRAMLLTAMSRADGPLGVRGLIDAVQDQFGETIPRTSVSPLLRKLAAKGEVIHHPDDATWSLGDVDRASLEKEANGEIVRFRGPKPAKRRTA
jgi:hypothetical protein